MKPGREKKTKDKKDKKEKRERKRARKEKKGKKKKGMVLTHLLRFVGVSVADDESSSRQAVAAGRRLR